MTLSLRPATADDAPRLAAMNRQLADDEWSRNRMDLAALTERMAKWLHEDWRAVLFEDGGDVVGYALFQIGADYYDPTIPEVYVRQFFIARERRGQGLGREAFGLLRTLLPAGATIQLDVLATNPGGQRFWAAVGFQPYSTAMKLSGPKHG